QEFREFCRLHRYGRRVARGPVAPVHRCGSRRWRLARHAWEVYARMTKRIKRSGPARAVAALVSALLIALLAANVASAYGLKVPGWTEYDDAIAKVNQDKAAQDRAMQDLEHALEDTDAKIVEANRRLQELNARLPVVQEEYRL